MKKSSKLYDKIKSAKNVLNDWAKETIINDLKIERWNGRAGVCPFHIEDTASFSWDEKEHRFYCFGCSKKYDIINHMIDFYKMSSADTIRAILEKSEIAFDEKDFTDEDNKSDFMDNYEYPQEIDNGNMDIIYNYLSRRGISKATVNYVGLKEKDGNIVFDYRDENGKLLCRKLRPARAIQKGEPKMFWDVGSDKKKKYTCPSLFNKDKINLGEPLILSEGCVDAISLIEAGIVNSTSVPLGAQGDSWIDFNFKWLENFPKIVLFFDDDEPGKKAMKAIAPRLGTYRTFIVEVDDDTKYQLKEAVKNGIIRDDKGDANNILIACGKERLHYLVENAKEIPNSKLVPLMKYEETDIQSMKIISTGFANLDKIIHGTIQNTLTIITGRTGSGKSTVINTMSIIMPIEDGQKVMVYSGEANGSILKGSLMRPIAGKNHVIEWENPGKPNGYTVTKEAKQKIEEYYNDKLWYYEDEDEMLTPSADVLENMEYAYKRYGITTIVLDNLMTLSCTSSDGDDKYSSQIKFVMALKRFTRKFPVNIFLIAHARKLQLGTKDVGMDDIAGASEIIKLADRAFSIGVLTDDEQGYNSLITVIKDRQTGKIDSKVKLYFDYKTLRMFSNTEEYNKKYQWEQGYMFNYNEYISEKIITNTDKKYFDLFGR